jgi:hypothetical protein
MTVRVEGDIARIELGAGRETAIDAADLPLVRGLAWHAHYHPASARWYARAWLAGGHIYLHRFILAATPEQVVTHVNGDGLDNRRENLRRWRKRKRRAEP